MARPYVLRFDWLILAAAFGVIGLGLPYLHSADPASFRKQAVWVLIGFGAMGATLAIPYRLLLHYAYELYAASLSLLVIVLMLPPIRNARSWIRIPGAGFSLQPTELMKVALILVLVRHLMNKENQATLRGLVMPFVLTLVPMGLILKQPDLGSAILLPPLLFALIFASGARLLHLAAIAICGASSAAPLWMFIMKPYQKNRIRAFLDPERYEAREAYQLIMSLLAIGSGGAFGEGLGNGTLNELDLLPDKHTDFIFGVIAEEGGFAVAALLLILYLILVLAGLHTAYNTREPGGRLIAVGCASLLGVQVLINVGVVTALLPTTGITLPLVSYGGSSMVVSFVLIGLLLNVGASRPSLVWKESFAGQRPE